MIETDYSDCDDLTSYNSPGMVECENCTDRVHRTTTYSANAFDMDRVCEGCVFFFLDAGRFPDNYYEKRYRPPSA